jgi:MFS family permease
MIINVVGIVGAFITIIPNTFTFIIGRFLGGYTTGAFGVTMPLFLNEISPPDISGRIGGLT